MMRLMNKELAESLEKYPLYSQDGKKADAVVVAKYFFPLTALTWYVTEGRKEDDDYLFFGLVVGTDTSAEMGYFSLSQLMDLNVCGLKVERDMYFKKGCLIRLKDMNIRVNIAIMSHLSDAQAMLDFGLKKEANSEINLAKAILLAHPNTDDWATEDELNEIVSRTRQ